MTSGLFESFCEMLESIPIKAVVRAADAERKMVEEDLEKKRAEPNEDITSVLSFCSFLTLSHDGGHATLPPLPVEHCAFYRKIVRRLVEAGELPSESTNEFEGAFSIALSRALTTEDKRESETPTFTQRPAYSFN